MKQFIPNNILTCRYGTDKTILILISLQQMWSASCIVTSYGVNVSETKPTQFLKTFELFKKRFEDCRVAPECSTSSTLAPALSELAPLRSVDVVVPQQTRWKLALKKHLTIQINKDDAYEQPHTHITVIEKHIQGYASAKTWTLR